MTRSSSKRKSDSALVTGKSSKHRKLDDQESSHEEEDSDSQLFVEDKAVPKYVKKTAVKSRKSEPARLRNDEYEEDEGRMDSQHFLAIVEYESKKKKRAAKAASEYMDRFQENVHSTNDALKMRIANQAAESANKSTTFLNAFRNAYALSRPLPPPSPSNSPSDDRNEVCFVTMFTRSQSLITNALNLITTFATANTNTENCQVAELLDNEWEKEVGAAASVLAIGCNVGLEKYQALLQGAEQPTVEENDEDFVGAICGQQEQGSFDYGWGKVAKKSEKAVKKFVRFQRLEV